MLLNVAVVDDSMAYQKIMGVIFSKIENELGASISVSNFISPLDYKLSNEIFDVVILDCIFKSHPVNINGFSLAKFTKDKSKKTKIMLTSEFEGADFPNLIKEQNIPVDYYLDKRIQDGNIEGRIKAVVEELLGGDEYFKKG